MTQAAHRQTERHPDQCDRLSARRAVLLEARCSVSQWRVAKVELADISAGGCRMLTRGEALKVGQEVVLRIAHLNRLRGHVRWVLGNEVGVEFTQALRERTAAQIARAFTHA